MYIEEDGLRVSFREVVFERSGKEGLRCGGGVWRFQKGILGRGGRWVGKSVVGFDTGVYLLRARFS